MSKKIHSVLLALVLTAFFAHSAFALRAKLEKVAEGLTAPMTMRSANDGSGRLFIVEQTGKIKILKDGQVSDTPFLDISDKLLKQHQFFDERGLLSVAFHPKFKDNGKYYVYYSYALTDESEFSIPQKIWWSHVNRIAEFTASGDTTDVSTERKILDIPWPQFNHNGGDMSFGRDGMLYISVGDGGYANDWGIGHNPKIGNGQDLSVLFGKIIRININKKGKKTAYTIPKNPFRNRKGARPEIWAYGFRNPWRMSHDMGGKGQLFVGDVQQNSYEEVDIVRRGGNYGWRIMEGNRCFDYLNPDAHEKKKCSKKGLIQPILVYNNCNKTPKNCRGLSVTGGFVYRGSNKKWNGYYFFGDWSRQFGTKDGSIFVGKQRKKGWKMEGVIITNIKKFDSYILGFGQDAKGEVYVMTTKTTGPTGTADVIYKITP